MKRLRSTDDLDSYGDKSSNRSSSSSHRSFYYSKPSEAPHKGLPTSSSSRYDRDRPVDEDGRDSSRSLRKRSDHDLESFDRRKGPGFDRYSERKGYGGDFAERDGYSGYRGLIHRSESFSGSKREFPKGYRSQRDRSRHEGSASTSSWQRIGNMGKDFDEIRGVRGSFMEDRERKGLREVRSPSRSKDSGSEQSKKGFRDGKARESDKEKSPSMSRGDSGNELLSKSRSPSNRFIDRRVKEKERSPSCSSERSRSVEAKKNEDVQVECGSTSEMEEGELEPETKLGPDPVAEAGRGNGMASLRRDEQKADEDLPDQSKSTGSSTPSGSSCGSGDEDDSEVGKQEETVKPVDKESAKGCEQEVNGHPAVEVQTGMEVVREYNQENAIDPEAKTGDVAVMDSSKGVREERAVPEGSSRLPREGSTLDFMDKGKSIAVAVTDYMESVEISASIKDESRDETLNKEICLEGPSARGFELFSSSPVRKPEKSDQSGFNKLKEEKRLLEPLDLSLSLPNVLLPIGAPETSAPASPSQGRSVQSWSTFRTNSDAFTMSMSFSGSQSFFHNPSCSLTQNEMDFEKSVGSRPIFGGVDWEGLAQNESKHKEVPQYPRMHGQNQNGSVHAPQGEHIGSNGQLMHGQNQNVRASEGSSKMHKGLERQLIFQKQIPGQSKIHDEAKSPAQSVGSHEIGSSYSFERKRAMIRDKNVGGLHRTASLKEGEQIWFGGVEFFEAIIEKIITEPISEMARKFHEMRGDVVASMKDRAREIMLNPDKHGQLLAFQKALQNRSDITLEALLNCNRTQLEILVAMRTGLSDFLQPSSGISSSDLAEVFLNLKCRNLACRSALPVNECDCKVCGPRNGFCSDCMCLVCSKFDLASNTCKWVGCDVCLHWCHVDCALRESYIRNGQSATSAQGATEMQFHCVACDHPSEMFGFVKEVFQNFAREWTAENLYRELEYVKRIFHGSKDIRGRRLYEIADQLLPRLGSKANLAEIYSYIMSFLNDGDSSKFGNTVPSGSEQGRGGNGVLGAKQDMVWVKSVYSEKAPLQMEHGNTLLPSSNLDRNEKLTSASDLQRSSQKPVFDELDSIIKIKRAEASMFQSRADDARREAEGLKRIAMAKNEKIEEEYAARIAKLRIAEAEEDRKQKFEELQALERAHRDYFNMKLRMEADIKDLLLKMESTKRNLAI
ncbi:protein OBERON 4 [Punica granatum]|uniref:Protein OBERON 4 n=2 Tax=Punica granatum TaxID=22663 RepID=A0A6P8C0P7_PUNGR|nr:protein OBERON 4 [Punica granatum]XP_031376159.1 protein OBERON 4 [Punica granatum]XP_031376160.1 protein OBERON 4 [Punica granatum]PKI31895.1 hypothetical protein CRG98_047705 [Punica granatum]